MRTATKTVLSALMTTGLCLSVIGCGSSGDSSQSEMQGNESNQIKSNKPKRLRQAPRGCCPGRAAARRTRGIPTEFRAASARRRQFGGDAGPRGPSRIRRSAPPPGHIGRQAEQGGLASAADRGNPGKSPQRRKAPQKLLPERRTRVGKSRRACRTPAAPSIAARGRACPKGPENDLGTGSCADASAPSAMRHRGRRRKGGGDVREPQGDDVAQAERDHEAQEQGAARAARDDPDGGVRGLHGERLRGRRGRRAP